VPLGLFNHRSTNPVWGSSFFWCFLLTLLFHRSVWKSVIWNVTPIYSLGETKFSYRTLRWATLELHIWWEGTTWRGIDSLGRMCWLHIYWRMPSQTHSTMVWPLRKHQEHTANFREILSEPSKSSCVCPT
jgi:hypothetical protein